MAGGPPASGSQRRLEGLGFEFAQQIHPDQALWLPEAHSVPTIDRGEAWRAPAGGNVVQVGPRGAYRKRHRVSMRNPLPVESNLRARWIRSV